MRPLVIDLCSGTGGASAAARDLGCEVVTVDCDAAFAPSVVADVMSWSWPGRKPLAIWASPPCYEFSRWGMPWLRRRSPALPDMRLLAACCRIIRECAPDYWIVENVQGAVPFFTPILGEPVCRYGGFFLWGKFPRPPAAGVPCPAKCGRSSRERVARAAVPAAVSWVVWREVITDAAMFGRV